MLEKLRRLFTKSAEAGPSSSAGYGMKPSPPTPSMNDVEELIRNGKLMYAIKAYRELTGAGLREAKETVEAMARGEPVKVPPTLPLAATIDDVVSQVKAGQMIHAIKTYREVTGAGLKEAKEAVDVLAAEYRTGRDH
jgi:ribosomal protein L7/L12